MCPLVVAEAAIFCLGGIQVVKSWCIRRWADSWGQERTPCLYTAPHGLLSKRSRASMNTLGWCCQLGPEGLFSARVPQIRDSMATLSHGSKRANCAPEYCDMGRECVDECRYTPKTGWSILRKRPGADISLGWSASRNNRTVAVIHAEHEPRSLTISAACRGTS